MKTKTKKIIYRILKIIWFILGGFALLWTVFFFIKMQTINTLGVIAAAVLFAAGIYILAIYIIVTLLFLFIKWTVKKFRRTKHSKK